MKRHAALVGLTLAACAILAAQESGNRVVVPARNSTRPRLVKASLLNAGITVKTHAGRDVIVESSGSSTARRREERTPEGLKRIDVPFGGFSVEEEDNVITIHGTAAMGGNVVVTVPVDTSVDLKSTHGGISVDGLHGEVVLSSTNGRIASRS